MTPYVLDVRVFLLRVLHRRVVVNLLQSFRHQRIASHVVEIKHPDIFVLQSGIVCPCEADYAPGVFLVIAEGMSPYNVADMELVRILPVVLLFLVPVVPFL